MDLLRRVARDGEPALALDGWDASLVAVAPSAALCVVDGATWRRDGAGAWRATGDAPWIAMRAFLREGAGAHVAGLVSYDAGRLIERVPTLAADDARVPQLLLFRFDAAFVDGRLHERAPGAGATMQARLSEPEPARVKDAPFAPLVARTPQKGFEEMVLRAKEAIRAGEVFQANLSHRLETATDVHPVESYARLRAANPAPFAGYLASGDLPAGLAPFHVVSSSPERLFRLRAGLLEARPIAGTRPRGATSDEDKRLIAELRVDAKERAEHVMLVDLARNDLGRVARFGTVRVPRLLDVESYPTVHHLVSTVEADLAPGKDVVDALVAMFPGGTITGAPKPRAMELIEAIEPVRRGVYTGSLGVVFPDGSSDWNILIRTLLAREGRVHLQVGAGIVEDSVPAREWDETLAKARGLLRAMGLEGARLP